uniref:Uncharacterized protein n=1 Tax=Janibacter limosus TaxID=53458 RepID=A0AC61U1T5_9MICO|nr:hypothetical protein [Janibacter limosus]
MRGPPGWCSPARAEPGKPRRGVDQSTLRVTGADRDEVGDTVASEHVARDPVPFARARELGHRRGDLFLPRHRRLGDGQVTHEVPRLGADEAIGDPGLGALDDEGAGGLRPLGRRRRHEGARVAPVVRPSP